MTISQVFPTFGSKVLEKSAYDQVVNFLAAKKILDPFQTGFRKYHNSASKTHWLYTYEWVGETDMQFDFSKAFDEISPSQLLMKLMGLGFFKVALSWFWSYLCERCQCVFSRAIFDFRIPQRKSWGTSGSVLGPLLYINVNHITKKENRALFGLKFIWSCTTQGLRMRLVESLVTPHLDYCRVVYLDATSSFRTCLQRLSNACLRFIFGVRRDTHNTIQASARMAP